MPYLDILVRVRCKECQHTERSRSTREDLVVPLPRGSPGDPEGHETQQSLRDRVGPSSTRLVALVDQWSLFVLAVQVLDFLSRLSLLLNLFLLVGRVDLGDPGFRSGQTDRALLGFPFRQEGRQGRAALLSYCGIPGESGSASCRSCSFGCSLAVHKLVWRWSASCSGMQSLPSLPFLLSCQLVPRFLVLRSSLVFLKLLDYQDYQDFPLVLVGLLVQIVPPSLVVPVLRMVRLGLAGRQDLENLDDQADLHLRSLPLVLGDQALQAETVR